MDLEQSEDYYGMARPCEGCGQMKQCQIPWAELYCLQYSINPAAVGRAIRREDILDTNWVYDSRFKCFHPGYRCGCTGNPLVLFNMTPMAAEAALKAAGRNGVISQEQQSLIRTISPVVRQMAEQKSGVPARQMQQQYARVPVPQGQPMQGYPPQQVPGMPPNAVPVYPPPWGNRR